MRFIKNFLVGVIIFCGLFSCIQLNAQMITGVWQGKIDKQKVEVKIIQNGDSLTGTSYYYQSPQHYRRYSIKGYFNKSDNSVVWWDDQLIENKTGSSQKPTLLRADFNCPGGGVMKLDGKTYIQRGPEEPRGDVHLDKAASAVFGDEWDYVINNYTSGANDRDVIDSIAIVSNNVGVTGSTPETTLPDPVKVEPHYKKQPVTVVVIPPKTTSKESIQPLTIEQKFAAREKVFNKEIPISGDSIELRFYDDAIVDGDSISLFLNGKLIFEHIGLTEKAYVIKLSVRDLPNDNELTMVAENLGSIPPNTSYMVAMVGDKRYDAQLSSTENSSAMVRLKKTAGNEP